jgi:hypothetical protein
MRTQRIREAARRPVPRGEARSWEAWKVKQVTQAGGDIAVEFGHEWGATEGSGVRAAETGVRCCV